MLQATPHIKVTEEEIIGIFGDWQGPQKLGVTDEATFSTQLKKHAEAHMPHVQLYPNVKKTLALLHSAGCSIAIVSSSYRSLVSSVARKQGLLAYVDIIIGGEGVTRHKPNPESLEKAINTLKLDPHSHGG